MHSTHTFKCLSIFECAQKKISSPFANGFNHHRVLLAVYDMMRAQQGSDKLIRKKKQLNKSRNCSLILDEDKKN